MGKAAGSRSFELGTGDDELRIEQGIALEGVSQLGQAPKTIQAQEAIEAVESRTVQDVKEIKATDSPIEQKVEEIKPEEPAELQEVIQTAAAEIKPDLVIPDPRPEEIEKKKEIEKVRPPQQEQVATIQQTQQVEIEEAKASSAKQSGGDATITTAYLGSLRATIERNTVNPRNSLSGRTLVSFEIDSTGNLLSFSVKESSGYPALDRAALSAVRDAAPYPAFPEGVNKKPLTVTVPIKFNVKK